MNSASFEMSITPLVLILNTVESWFLEPSVSRTSRYLEPNLVSLGFASLKLYNFTPDSRPIPRIQDPFKTLTEEINNLRERAPELAQENVTAGIVVECDDDAATFEADPLTVEDIIAEFNYSAYANEEEEEEMDEDEIAIVDEPPKPPTQCELRHMQSACLTHSAFLLMMRTSIICAKVPGTFLKS